tara:strand:- start:5644 stop:5850 length:207 start_codon:yes stop_codon:yes gene_type:complete
MAYKSTDVAVSDGIKKKKSAKTGRTALTEGRKIKILADGMLGGMGGTLGLGDKAAAKWEAQQKAKKNG